MEIRRLLENFYISQSHKQDAAQNILLSRWEGDKENDSKHREKRNKRKEH